MTNKFADINNNLPSRGETNDMNTHQGFSLIPVNWRNPLPSWWLQGEHSPTRRLQEKRKLPIYRLEELDFSLPLRLTELYSGYLRMYQDPRNSGVWGRPTMSLAWYIEHKTQIITPKRKRNHLPCWKTLFPSCYSRVTLGQPKCAVCECKP